MDSDNLNRDTEDNGTAGRQSARRKFLALLGATVVATGAFFGLQAMAETNTYRHLTLAAGDGWHKGWHRRGFSDLTDTEIEDRIERMVKHVGIEIDATQEQEIRLTELVTAAARDMRPLREGLRRSHDEMRDLLTADTIDREAIERLRVERLAEFDRVSKNLVDTLVDVAQVLTADQRRLLEERIEELRSHRDRHRRG